MELYAQIVAKLLENEKMEISFPALRSSIGEMAESACYRALQRIKAVIEDDSLEDEECFMKIEEIMQVFEGLGSENGSRHDL